MAKARKVASWHVLALVLGGYGQGHCWKRLGIFNVFHQYNMETIDGHATLVLYKESINHLNA